MEKIIRHILLVASITMLAACRQDAPCQPEDGAVGSGSFRLFASISRAADSRAVTDPDDNSNKLFAVGDKIGFYSQGGNLDAGNAGFNNAVMTYKWRDSAEWAQQYSGGMFVSEEMNMDQNATGNILAYYPYNENIDVSKGGMDIRDADGCCLDMLYAYEMKYNGTIGYSTTFYHAFSMLMIRGGEGFEHFMERPVEVKIATPVKKVVIDDSDLYFKNMKFLGADEGDEHDDDYYKTFVGRAGKMKDNEGRDVDIYCVIIPTPLGSGSMKVEAIRAYDDLGTLQEIRPASMWMSQGWRKPITLKMNGLVPTIYPHDVVRWNEEEIGVKDDVGIDTGDDFIRFIQCYNAYLNNDANASALTEFGTQENGVFHFYLNADIDCSMMPEFSNVSVVLNGLKDVFDGRNHKIMNLTLSNPGEAGFIHTISDGGELKNLVLENLTIPQATGCAGAMAIEMTGGLLTGCTVKGLELTCNGVVGGVAGRMAGGRAEWCTVEGFIIGTSTDQTCQKAVGAYSGGELEGVNTLNLIFGSYK